MTVKAVLFDLDDTLLWDERSVDEAFQATCQVAAQEAGVDPAKLEEAVRREARALYESYETYPFTVNIGINPFEGLWGKFEAGEDEHFRRLQRIVPHYRTDAWTQGLRALGVDDPELGRSWGNGSRKNGANVPMSMKKPSKCWISSNSAISCSCLRMVRRICSRRSWTAYLSFRRTSTIS